MIDREKVIRALHDARRYLEDKEWSDRGASPHIDSINDALALLKEQEAVVRCKDCKHRPIMPDDHTDGFDLKFPDGKCQSVNGLRYYNNTFWPYTCQHTSVQNDDQLPELRCATE